MSQRVYNRRKAKGFFAQVQQVILHPVAFFEALPEQAESRTWLMAAFLILLLIAYSAVQQKATVPEDFSMSTSNPVQQQVITGLMAAFGLMIAWLVQAALLLPVAILSQRKANFALNLHITIWASLPFALLAMIQIAYLWAGGPIGGAGLAPAISSVMPYETMTSAWGIFLLNMAEQFTLFGLWNLALLYLGARHSIQGAKGNLGIVLAFLLIWLILLLIVPTIIETMTVQQAVFS
jgi:hypothetical protein